MTTLREFGKRLAGLFGKSRLDAELDDEFALHLDFLAEEKIKQGMPSEDAHFAARRDFGGVEQFKQIYRERRGLPMLETFLQDLRFGARMLRKNPGFTAVAVLTLALGIGANTAIFSVVHAVLLSSLPYRQPEQLVKVWGQLTGEGIPRNWFSDPEWFELVDRNHAFGQVAAYYANNGANVGNEDAAPQRITRGGSTAGLFPLLGVQPILGRTYSAEEDQPGHNQVAVISYGLWRSLYSGDSNVVGKPIRLNNRPYTVIGVLPEGFDFAGDNQVWTPLALDRTHPNSRGSHAWDVIARLKPDVNLAQASADMDIFAQQLARENPASYGPTEGWGVFVVPLREELVGQIRPALLILMAAVGIVLLIACANITNLLLARSSAREKEMAIRASLGAGRWRTIRQLLTESLLLSLIGSAVGLALGAWAMLAIRGLHTAVLPSVGKIALDPNVLLFTLGIALFTGILFGLAPALHVSSPRLHDTLKEGGRGGSSGPGGQRLRSALVVSEIAFSLLLVIAAGLTIRSFNQLLRVDPGFRTDHILTMRMNLPSITYPNAPAVSQFYQKVLDRIRVIPGVETAGAISQLPMGNSYSSGSAFVEDSTAPMLQHIAGTPYGYLETDQRFITPGYFETMKTPLISGRVFSIADTATSPLVAIVDSEFAADIWPGQDPLQKHISIQTGADPNKPKPVWCTVVGVVGHVHNYSLDVAGRVQAYFPQTQDPFGSSYGMFFVIRTANNPTTVANSARAQVAAIDSREPVYAVRTMDEVVASSVEQPRLSLDLLGLFAAVAAILAAIGIYGVMAFAVSQRSHELGIRVALGAQPRDILQMVIGQGAKLAIVGVALGLAGALYLARYMAPLLFGVGIRDPITFVIVPLLLMGVAIAASWIPAVRATRVDPIVTLRHE
ncbi:MAG: ABC transporter permease [Candidatus Acidiferrales bacterium]